MATNALVKVCSIQSDFLTLRSAITFNMIMHTFLATDRDIETKPNEVYGLVSGQTNGYHDREFYEPLITMCIMYTIIIHGFWQWYR
jgi:hypothetical protein